MEELLWKYSSGSGKSTLLHLLGGVDRPTSGKIYIDGNEINNMNNDKLAIFRRRQIGIVYQFYNLIPILTVEENISLPCDLDGNRPDKERMDLILKSAKRAFGRSATENLDCKSFNK